MTKSNPNEARSVRSSFQLHIYNLYYINNIMINIIITVNTPLSSETHDDTVRMRGKAAKSLHSDAKRWKLETTGTAKIK